MKENYLEALTEIKKAVEACGGANDTADARQWNEAVEDCLSHVLLLIKMACREVTAYKLGKVDGLDRASEIMDEQFKKQKENI